MQTSSAISCWGGDPMQVDLFMAFYSKIWLIVCLVRRGKWGGLFSLPRGGINTFKRELYIWDSISFPLRISNNFPEGRGVGERVVLESFWKWTISLWMFSHCFCCIWSKKWRPIHSHYCTYFGMCSEWKYLFCCHEIIWSTLHIFNFHCTFSHSHFQFSIFNFHFQFFLNLLQK